MNPLKHIFLGAVFSLVFFFIFPKTSFFAIFIIFFSSFMIDIDHYFYYVYKKKNINPIKSVQWFLNKRKKYKKFSLNEKRKSYLSFPFLHGIEILIILFVLGRLISFYFYYVLIGFLFHLTLDYIYEFTKGLRIDKISLIYDFIKFKKLKYLD